MKNEKKVKEALLRLSSYCASAERCESDVRKKLERRDLAEDEISYIINYLTKENFLNESRYALAYVNDKYKFSKWGKRKIAQGLYLKGIPQECSQEALAAIDQSEYLENLRAILAAKKRTVKAKNDYELKQKLARFALGRGFDYGDIMQFLPELEDEF